jgi:hypothetical protein
MTSLDDFAPDDFRRTNPRFQGENLLDARFPADVAAGARYPDMSPIEPLTPEAAS